MYQIISLIKTALVRLVLGTATVTPSRATSRSLVSTRKRGAALVLALVAAFTSAPLYAVAGSQKALFGPIGVTAGEVVRVSMYGDPCEFVVSVFNVRGEKVQEIRLEQDPGVTGFADIAIGNDKFPPDRLGRRTLRVEIVGFNPQPDPPGDGDYSATLEVFNRITGRTTVLLGGSDTVPAPQ